MIGREKEQSSLLRLLEEEESQFCVVYGRRRVGKTYLVRETFGGHFAFFHTGLANARQHDQLKEFHYSLRQSGLKTGRCPRDWFEAFHMLEELLSSKKESKKVVFLDELPWMDTPRSNFLSALEHFWNGWANMRIEKDIVLIVCGSASSWIGRHLLKNYGGLYNRLTFQINLKPFCLAECEEFSLANHLGFSRKDIAEAYMIFGGIPYYWSFFRKGESLAQAVDRMFFSANAPLNMEFDALYASLFKNSQSYISVVTAMSKHKSGMTRKEIMQATGLPDNSQMTDVLNDLEQCDFIRKYLASGRKKRDAIYQLMDNFTLFHFRFLIDNAKNDEHCWVNSIDTSRHHAWAGLAFERLCLWHLPQIKKALGIDGMASCARSWQLHAVQEEEGAQIDLLIERADNVVNVCEIKYAEGEYQIEREEWMKMRRRIETFRRSTGCRSALHLTLITTYGVARNAYWGEVQREITLDDLFD